LEQLILSLRISTYRFLLLTVRVYLRSIDVMGYDSHGIRAPQPARNWSKIGHSRSFKVIYFWICGKEIRDYIPGITTYDISKDSELTERTIAIFDCTLSGLAFSAYP